MLQIPGRHGLVRCRHKSSRNQYTCPMASTCPRACVSNQHWRPVETPSTEVFNDHSPLRGSLPQENRPVREQPLLRLSKQNMTVETATQSAWAKQSTFTRLRGHNLLQIFCATLRVAKTCRARRNEVAHSLQVLRDHARHLQHVHPTRPRPLSSSIRHT